MFAWKQKTKCMIKKTLKCTIKCIVLLITLAFFSSCNTLYYCNQHLAICDVKTDSVIAEGNFKFRMDKDGVCYGKFDPTASTHIKCSDGVYYPVTGYKIKETITKLSVVDPDDMYQVWSGKTKHRVVYKGLVYKTFNNKEEAENYKDEKNKELLRKKNNK